MSAQNGEKGWAAKFQQNSIVHLCFACIYLCSGLVVNMLQAATMIFWWSGKVDLYRTLNIRLAYLNWALIPFLSEWWAGIKVSLYMRPEDFKKVSDESAIVVMNHKYDMDWIIGWVIADRVKILGNAKCMAKSSLSYVPVMGWAWRFCEYIFVKRDLEADTKTILKALKNLAEFKHYFWMLIYCEGTRFTEAKHKLSMEVAEKKGLKPLIHHLLPRTKGFRMLTRGLRDSVSAVYDCTVAVDDSCSPTLLDLLCGKSYNMGILVTRRPLEDVPDNDEECAAYLHQMYQEKDDDFDYYMKHNEYATEGSNAIKYPGLQVIDLPRRTECLWIAIGWAVFILTPLLYYIWTLIVAAELFKIAALAIGLGVVSFIFRKILAETQISSSSSSYGSNKKTK